MDNFEQNFLNGSLSSISDQMESNNHSEYSDEFSLNNMESDQEYDGLNNIVDSMELISRIHRQQQKQEQRNKQLIKEGQQKNSNVFMKKRKNNCRYCGKQFPNVEIKQHEDECFLSTFDDNESQESATFGCRQKKEQIVQQQQQKIKKQVCEYCKKELQENEIQKHRDACEARLQIEYENILCPYCGEEIVRAFLKDHLDECISYIEEKFKKLDNVVECSICMGEIIKNKVKLKCDHDFHKECIEEWLKKKQECPVCRQKVQK